jgi:hypothetical protein
MQDSDDFGYLYRAALAETDPKKKSNLLQKVQLILMQWHETLTPTSDDPDQPNDLLKNSAA